MSEAKETVFDTHTYHFFYIAIGKISNFTWISTRQRVGKKSDNCIGDSFPSILFRVLTLATYSTNGPLPK